MATVSILLAVAALAGAACSGSSSTIASRGFADPSSRNAQGATFQRYLNMTPIDVLSEEARQEREGLLAWLKAHDVPLEDVPRSR